MSSTSVPDLGIGGYAGLTEVARGGFGVVYQARQDEFDRTVAIKVLSGVLDERARQRFERERRAMGSLSNHPNIVTVYASGLTENDRPFIVMEYMAGGSLAQRLEQGPMPWSEAVAVGVKLANALAAAHQAGVLHRDIKPENVLVSAYGEPMLADFGIARLQGGPETRSGVITASLAHAAPEILDGKRPTEAADVYSLASTIHTLITGQSPFARDTDESIVPMLARIATEPAPDLRPRNVPDRVCEVLEVAMVKDPEQRTSTAAELARRLNDAQTAETSKPGSGLVTPVGKPRADTLTVGGPGGSADDSATPAPGRVLSPQPALSEAAQPSTAGASPSISSRTRAGGPALVWVVGILVVVVLLVGGVALGVLLTRNDDESASGREVTPEQPTTTIELVDLPTSASFAFTSPPTQAGREVVGSVSVDRSSGIRRLALLVDGAVVDEATAVTQPLAWTPSAPGTYEVWVAVTLTDGSEMETDRESIVVGPYRFGSADVPADAAALADEFAAALSAHDWNKVRGLEIDKTTYTDAQFEEGYRSLVRNTFIGVRWEDRGGGWIRLYGGLVADEAFQTRFFCVAWDVNPSLRQVDQLDNPLSRLVRDTPGSVPPEQFEAEAVSIC